MTSLVAAGTVVLAACGTTDGSDVPPELRDPAVVQTAAGAIGYYRQIITTRLAGTVDPVLGVIGLFTDELSALPVPLTTAGLYTLQDSRKTVSSAIVSTTSEPYLRLHKLRAQTRDARGYLHDYASDSSLALSAHLYALEGYAEIYLADLFCSGIPLSTVDYGADYTMAAGSTTEEVYSHAIFLLDSALAFGADSARIQQFAAVGRGRALLALGRYADAAAAVAAVPDEFRYQVTASPATGTTALPTGERFVHRFFTGSYATTQGRATVSNLEGFNGMNYRTSNDPRTLTAVLTGTDANGNQGHGPRKYQPFNGNNITYTIASGVEARLIEAEAALQVGDTATWRAKLNQPRQTACSTIVPVTTCPLALLDDPGASLSDPAAATAARVDLQFRERAFWLFLTGHRQGDLRRLIRQYGRAATAVYPTGVYPGYDGAYSSDVLFAVPIGEAQHNPLYSGCFNRSA